MVSYKQCSLFNAAKAAELTAAHVRLMSVDIGLEKLQCGKKNAKLDAVKTELIDGAVVHLNTEKLMGKMKAVLKMG
jgi:hypothetical protein